jgi:hypothetical protein
MLEKGKTAIILSIHNTKKPNNIFVGLHGDKYICFVFQRIQNFSKLLKKVNLPRVARSLSRTLYNAQKFGAQYA